MILILQFHQAFKLNLISFELWMNVKLNIHTHIYFLLYFEIIDLNYVKVLIFFFVSITNARMVS